MNTVLSKQLSEAAVTGIRQQRTHPIEDDIVYWVNWNIWRMRDIYVVHYKKIGNVPLIEALRGPLGHIFPPVLSCTIIASFLDSTDLEYVQRVAETYINTSEHARMLLEWPNESIASPLPLIHLVLQQGEMIIATK